MPPTPLHNLCIVVILKSGEMRGNYKWKIVTETPSHKQLPAVELNALFEGDERGIAFVSPLLVVAEEEGLYWFDVFLTPDVLLTRIPLRVIYQKIQPMSGNPFQPPQHD